MSDSLWPHGLQHSRPHCPSPTPGVYSNSCPLIWWCHPNILSLVIPFSSCPQSFPASGSFPMSQLFTSGGQRIGVSASASVLPMNIQDWFFLWDGPVGSPCSPRDSQESSPQPGVKPRPPALVVWHPSRWTTREVPQLLVTSRKPFVKELPDCVNFPFTKSRIHGPSPWPLWSNLSELSDVLSSGLQPRSAPNTSWLPSLSCCAFVFKATVDTVLSFFWTAKTAAEGLWYTQGLMRGGGWWHPWPCRVAADRTTTCPQLRVSPRKADRGQNQLQPWTV